MLFSMMVASCAPKVSFKIHRPPLQQVQNIKYIEIGKHYLDQKGLQIQ